VIAFVLNCNRRIEMQSEEFFQAIRRRRSIRRFRPDPVPDGYVEKILDMARWAMSGANAQPWEFVVVRDRGTIDRMADAWFGPRMEAYSIEQTRVEGLRHHQLSTAPSSPGFKDAPVLILVLGDNRTYQATILATNYITMECGPNSIYLKNIANATQYLCLAASVLGLGAQWLSVDSVWAQSVKELLDVPAILDIHAIVPVGYPAYEPAPPYRRELDEIVHYEKYDRSKYRTGEDVIKFLYHLRDETRKPYSQEKSA
jgi:nitroreductase